MSKVIATRGAASPSKSHTVSKVNATRGAISPSKSHMKLKLRQKKVASRYKDKQITMVKPLDATTNTRQINGQPKLNDGVTVVAVEDQLVVNVKVESEIDVNPLDLPQQMSSCSTGQHLLQRSTAIVKDEYAYGIDENEQNEAARTGKGNVQSTKDNINYVVKNVTMENDVISCWQLLKK